MQTLHNIDEGLLAYTQFLLCDTLTTIGSMPLYVSIAESSASFFTDELAGFEEEWKGKGQKYLPGWSGSVGE